MQIDNSYGVSGIFDLSPIGAVNADGKYSSIQESTTPSGDTVQISDEAKQLFSQMIHKYDREDGQSENAGSEMGQNDGAPAGGNDGGASGTQGSEQASDGSQGGGGGGGGGSSDDQESIEQQIQALKSQMASLASQMGSGGDSAAMSKISALQAQIAALEAQLNA